MKYLLILIFHFFSFFCIVSFHFVPKFITVRRQEVTYIPIWFYFATNFTQNAAKVMHKYSFFRAQFFFVYFLLQGPTDLCISYRFQFDTSTRSRDKRSWQTNIRTTKWSYKGSVKNGLLRYWTLKMCKILFK